MPKPDVEWIRERLRGVIPPLCTILRPDGGLWPEAQSELLDCVAPHVDALFVSGTTGVCPWLTPEQQEALIRQARAWISRRGQRKPVLCAALGHTANEVAGRARALHAAGADAVVVYTPHFFRHTEEELLAYFVQVAERAEGVPLVLYNLPQMTKNDMTPSLARQVTDATGSYVAIKDSKGDPGQFEELFELRDRLNILAGDEEICRLVLGRADGCVPAAANVFPLLWRRIMDESRDAEALGRHHASVMAVKRDVYGLPAMPQVISGILTALEMLQIGDGPTAPFLPVERLAAGQGLRERIAATLRKMREYVPEPWRSRIP